MLQTFLFALIHSKNWMACTWRNAECDHTFSTLVTRLAVNEISHMEDLFETANYSFSILASRAHRFLKEDKQNQTIQMSGLSGAGKTEAAKNILSYICRNTALEEKIGFSTTLFESFGNAMTSANTNSSRFCKLTKVNIFCSIFWHHTKAFFIFFFHSRLNITTAPNLLEFLFNIICWKRTECAESIYKNAIFTFSMRFWTVQHIWSMSWNWTMWRISMWEQRCQLGRFEHFSLMFFLILPVSTWMKTLPLPC